MYLKILGAIIILLSCGGIGFRIAHNHNRELSVLQQLINVLDFMECELQYRLTPLPDLCRQAASEQSGILSSIFLCLSQELEDQISPNVDACMHAALNRIQNIPPSTLEIMKQLGRSLGRFDIEGQLLGLESIRQICRQTLRQLNEHKQIHLRGYQTLGLCAGAALVILFI